MRQEHLLKLSEKTDKNHINLLIFQQISSEPGHAEGQRFRGAVVAVYRAFLAFFPVPQDFRRVETGVVERYCCTLAQLRQTALVERDFALCYVEACVKVEAVVFPCSYFYKKDVFACVRNFPESRYAYFEAVHSIDVGCVEIGLDVKFRCYWHRAAEYVYM